jgi:peptide/nickel transport system permease protein
MLNYVRMRSFWSIIVIMGVVTLVFILLRVLPGDPADKMISDWGLSAEDLARLKEQWGLNDPIYVQFGRFIWDALHGDFGRSIWSRRLVTEHILTQLPATIQLAIAGLLVTILTGIPLGIIAAVRQNTWIDNFCMLLALFGVSMPSFWLGLVLLLTFAVGLGWFPMAGTGGLKYLILPAITLGFRSAGSIARITRSSMLEVMRQDYIVTARAKGLTERVVIVLHALKNALIPVVTILGLQLAGLLGGTVITETVFARKGIGVMAVSAVQEKDYPLMQGIVVFISGTYVLVNLAVDLLYAKLDPRIHYEG